MQEEMHVKENLQCCKNLKPIIELVLFQAFIGTVILRTLDIFTIVVPPALPAAMTAGTTYSQNTSGIYAYGTPPEGFDTHPV
jgi:cation-transporting ATPase 13A3/4/5